MNEPINSIGLYTRVGDDVRLLFHEGQERAWESVARFILVLAGTQGGKTSFSPHWLFREMCTRGQGDYLVAGPTFQLLDKKCIPEFRRLFERVWKVGVYQASPGHILHITEEGARFMFGADYDPTLDTRILFGYATDPDSLESATAKAAVLDEAGQKKFKVGAWQAVLRRLALHSGRALITTSLYAWNWLKDLYDRWKAGDSLYDVVQFDSIANPAYPREEYERAQRELPSWLFNLQYRGQFERPAGLIYDCINEFHKVKRFAIPYAWPRYIGLDFGEVNTAAVVVAENPQTKQRIIENVYAPGRRTVREHVKALRALSPKTRRIVGGAKSEDDWRKDFALAGMSVARPKIADVDVGIQRVYGEFQNERLVFFDDLDEFVEELNTYGRAVDVNGNVTDEIEDKSEYHRLDALRYIMGDLAVSSGAVGVSVPRERSVISKGVF